jgi:Ca2+-binding EF-hand superfamily protein
MPESKFNEIFERLDHSRNGQIDYTEFLASTMNMNSKRGEQVLQRTFQFFDKNKDGLISKAEVMSALKLGWISNVQLESLFKEYDFNQDQAVSPILLRA